ncbi:hypothetical protein OS493_034187 [Desmophyllum pertusum]|uniref:G-protein coupled receptors family 1 profile domain-containing protein n=1 Tax=Desmophyllum pertusum TaxID=174260 RepID=A0A9W9ZJ88_9CNID|nr:hypothetical protein OS493_034187 [Desmophyllum pertusum]
MNETNLSRDTSDNGGQYSAGFLFILPIVFVIIFIGNLLLLVAIKLFRVRRVPDLLVGSLAGIDLLNDVGPVLMSMIVFQIDRNGFQSLNVSFALCHFYNWISSFLRLSASFIATLMALDCACATLQPIYYRTKVTCDRVAKVIFFLLLSAAFISVLPAMGWGRVYPHRGICSFDFGGSFALLIAILGYIQLAVVLTSFIAVARKMREYEKRLGQLRRGRTLTFQNGRLQAMELKVTQKKRMKDIRENSTYGDSRDEVLNTATRSISTLVEEEQCDKDIDDKCERQSCTGRRAHPRSQHKPRINRHVKESRQFTKILGSAVFLFYVSWMPIIVSITVELATRQHREVLQSLSAQMSLLSSILNPWVYCGLSRPYRRAYIYALRRVGRVCGVAQASQKDIVQIGDASSRFRTSTRRIFPDAR